MYAVSLSSTTYGLHRSRVSVNERTKTNGDTQLLGEFLRNACIILIRPSIPHHLPMRIPTSSRQLLSRFLSSTTWSILEMETAQQIRKFLRNESINMHTIFPSHNSPPFIPKYASGTKKNSEKLT